jgi:hypothetical protein
VNFEGHTRGQTGGHAGGHAGNHAGGYAGGHAGDNTGNATGKKAGDNTGGNTGHDTDDNVGHNKATCAQFSGGRPKQNSRETTREATGASSIPFGLIILHNLGGCLLRALPQKRFQRGYLIQGISVWGPRYIYNNNNISI